ncbi:MAG: type II toxin-antitoxin system VapC family toxin [Moorea sp. SIO1F2]|uniref:type II toxin-antitoxin system VapC family toxin n=1 Tax=Moorena sp. SIO1F2 TaxID=2607819 RepID=UPI0013B99910|nr:type II toxin-antitoxin system VapC family toxin [Moorena sp. SIO1F2]NEO03797.1 type II toxin-antitoxin system VapC family toxin [Moorena sp. SIO3I7]NET86421.1 type II toxin-antitoxin system VapC family toxin [Moorena sp. SIO1F2]
MSQVIVLDTHIWIWFINQEFERFPAHWRDVLETSEVVGVSPVSCYEVALAKQRGRLQLPCTAERWLQEALEPSGITLFPITAQIAYKAVNLSPVHKDPFDRLIIATALVYKAKLASIDGLFSKYSELDTYLMK